MQNLNIQMNANEQKVFEKLKTEVSQEIKSLKALNGTAKHEKNENIISMIKHYIDMSRNTEDVRNRIHTFTLQSLAIWFAAAILLIANYFNPNYKINTIFFGTAMTFLSVQIIFCLFSVFIYEKQTSFRYPFLWPELSQYGNAWKWFYYASKPLQKMTRDAIFRDKSFSSTAEPFLESYRDFIREYTFENLDGEICSNIQQLHLLRAHNYYKNQFLLQLTNIRKWAIIAIPISVVVGVVISLPFN